jgi:hypothetical protein
VGERVSRADESLELRWRLVDASETDLDRLVAEDGTAELTIAAPQTDPITLRYPSGPPGIPLARDPNPFVEYDHWDFGLFLKDVLDENGGTRLFAEDSSD